MNETSITLTHANTTSAGNHEFESPDGPNGQAICASYFNKALFETAPKYLSLVLGSSDPATTMNLDDSTKNYGVYQTEDGAITGVYISRDVLGAEDDEDLPESIGVSMNGATEEDWAEQEEQAEQATQDEAEALMSSADESEFVFDNSESAEAPADD